MEFLASSILALILIIMAARPYLSPAASQSFNEEESYLLEQKRQCLQVLRDLDLDHATGKVVLEEYNRMRARLELDLAAILKKLGRL